MIFRYQENTNLMAIDEDNQKIWPIGDDWYGPEEECPYKPGDEDEIIVECADCGCPFTEHGGSTFCTNSECIRNN